VTEDLVAETPFDLDDPASIIERAGSSVERGVTDHITQVAQYCVLAGTLVPEQEILKPIERVNQRLDLAAFHIACKEIQSQADFLKLPNANEIISYFQNWPFTLQISDPPTNPDCH
jgi:hypothetical protein